MDNIGNYEKVLQLHWSTCGFDAYYIVDTYEYVAINKSTLDIVCRAKTSSDLDSVVYLEYGGQA